MFSKLFNYLHYKFKHGRRKGKPEVPLYVNGGGCLATDRITVDGKKVGFMYRVKPTHSHKNLDNGWRFFAGDENQAYIDNLIHSHPYDTNTIANLDPAILPYLDSPYKTAFERIPGTNKFKEVKYDFANVE